MIPAKELKRINENIKHLRQTAEAINRQAGKIPAVIQNTARILAGVKMLELNVSDCLDADIVD